MQNMDKEFNYAVVSKEMGIDYEMFITLPELYQNALVSKYLKRKYLQLRMNDSLSKDELENQNIIKKVLSLIKKK